MKTEKTCIQCGNDFFGRPNKKFCSRFCKDNHSQGTPARSHLPPRNPIYINTCIVSGKLFTTRRPSKVHPQHRKEYIAQCYAVLRIDKHCKECNTEFKATPNGVFCSHACNKRYSHRIRRKKERARMRRIKVENVDPIHVFRLAGWRCTDCNTPTPRELLGKHEDNSPELDHIIPLSKGGTHEYVNVQLLCRRCNAIKSDVLV